MTTDPRVQLPEPFTDERGSIQNIFEYDTWKAGGVAVIKSRAGSTRSDHWHKEDAHHLFVLSGEVEYQWREADSPVSETRSAVYGEGRCFFTPAQVWHRVIFRKDSVLISVSKRGRDHESHESDLVRVPA